MDQIARCSTILPLLLISACLAIACNRGSDIDTRLAGDWRFSSLVVEDGCNLGPAVGPLAGAIQIMQTDNSLILEQHGCCTSGTIGTGRADGILFTATSTRSIPAGTNCVYQLDEVDTGTARGDRLIAEATVRVTLPNECFPPGIQPADGIVPAPCQIRGRIEATRCGPGGCGLICIDILPCGI